MSRKQDDFLRLLASKCQQGTKNLNYHMKKYISHQGEDSTYVINLEETWQKIKLAARTIVTVENSSDVIVVSSRLYGQRAVIKYAHYTGAVSTRSHRWTPGTLTNQGNNKSGKFQEPRLLIVTDPIQDKQAVIEASFVNIPTIALCNSDSPLDYIDIPIPCNNRSTESISMIYWLLAREVQILRGQLKFDEEWDVFVDLFYYREITNEQLAEENDKEQGEKEEEQQDQQQAENQGISQFIIYLKRMVKPIV